MEVVAVSLSLLSLAGAVAGGFIIRSYLPSYAAEKGKNAASKEDLAHLTQLVESVKALHVSEIEHLKATLLEESEVMERRRRVYEEMCSGLRVFQAGHGGTLEAKERFHAAHAAAWLWASDEVLSTLNHFIQIQVERTANPSSVDQIRMKRSYAAVIRAMRKDVGFANTLILSTDYQFVQF